MHICAIAIHALYFHIRTAVQCINDNRLDSFISVIIQCVDLHCLIENLLELLTNLRNREGNDGEASLFSIDILIYNIRRSPCIL